MITDSIILFRLHSNLVKNIILLADV